MGRRTDGEESDLIHNTRVETASRMQSICSWKECKTKATMMKHARRRVISFRGPSPRQPHTKRETPNSHKSVIKGGNALSCTSFCLCKTIIVFVHFVALHFPYCSTNFTVWGREWQRAPERGVTFPPRIVVSSRPLSHLYYHWESGKREIYLVAQYATRISRCGCISTMTTTTTPDSHSSALAGRCVCG